MFRNVSSALAIFSASRLILLTNEKFAISFSLFCVSSRIENSNLQNIKCLFLEA